MSKRTQVKPAPDLNAEKADLLRQIGQKEKQIKHLKTVNKALEVAVALHKKHE